MELDFYKIACCRNDFIVLSYLYKGEAPQENEFPLIAQRMCDRHSGVGGNGLVFLLPGTEHAARIAVFQRDGRPAPVYNDALICIGRLAFDSGVVSGGSLPVECPGRVCDLDFIDSTHLRISLGSPVRLPNGAELRETPNSEYLRKVEIDGKLVSLTPLRLQRSSVVLFPDDSPRAKLRRLSEQIRMLELYEEPVHPVFCAVYGKEEIAVSTWFRREPVDYSHECGAATIGAVVNGFADRDVVVHCNKAELYVQWVQATNEVLVTAQADYLFSGTYYFDEEKVD